MGSIIIRRKKTAANDDMNTIRLLRQQVYLNDQMLKLQVITDEEYNLTGEQLLRTVVMLEEKYGIKD